MCCGSQEKREVIITTHSGAVIDLLLIRDYRWNPSLPRSSNPTFLTCGPTWGLRHPIYNDWKSLVVEDIKMTTCLVMTHEGLTYLLAVFITTRRCHVNGYKKQKLQRLHVTKARCIYAYVFYQILFSISLAWIHFERNFTESCTVVSVWNIFSKKIWTGLFVLTLTKP